jgi:hypothetical protein
MEIKEKTVLVLGAYGEVGIAICRQILRYQPTKLIVTSLMEEESRAALNELQAETCDRQEIEAFFGNIFVRWSMKDMRVTDIVGLKDYVKTLVLVDDNLAELSEEIFAESTLHKLIAKYRPNIIIDCINTATTLSYQNLYQAYQQEIDVKNEHLDKQSAIYRLLSTTSIPPLVRHIQILYKSMKQVGTEMYLKIGTTGTGGMGVNIPFTHGEEAPSRLLMTKSAMAGAQTMLLYTINEAPGWPIVKEIKPAAMIGWKDVDKNTIKRGGKTYQLYDCGVERAYNLENGATFAYETMKEQGVSIGKNLEGVFIDTGENGVFSLEEFKIVSSLGLMEFVTPEDIAHHAIMNIIGVDTSKDVISAMGGAVMGSSYRAGVLRDEAIKKAIKFGADNENVTYGFIGPKISKLIIECNFIKQKYSYIESVLDSTQTELASSLEELVISNHKLRAVPISLGIPILLTNGKQLLFAKRAIKDKNWENVQWTITAENIDQWASNGWVDLRPDNIKKWQKRFLAFMTDIGKHKNISSSRFNLRATMGENRKTLIDVGEIISWILIKEMKGGKISAYHESDPLYC